LASGTLAAALHHGLSLPQGAMAGIKGGWLGAMATYPSEMAQNFWTAIWAWSACFVITIGISLVTQPKPREELLGLVYSLTPKQKGDSGTALLGAAVIAGVVILNLLFW
jgi:SSS family solute:Na+ symporter